MKRKIYIGIFSLLTILFQPVLAQSDESEQLLLNVEKLAQLKKILNNMYKGYQIVSKGYNTIKSISNGSFNIHKEFLDGLLKVSPAVKKYKRVTDIISCQGMIVKEYKNAYNRFKKCGLFNVKEINYMGAVYKNLFERSAKCLDDLLMVITADKLRMSDEERLEAIDRIFASMEDKLSFLRHFNRSTTVLTMQRGKETVEIKVSQQLHDVTDK